MIKSLNNFFKKSGLYKSKYVYIYSDFRIFISFYKSNPELYIKKFLRLFTDKGITCVVPSFSYTVSGSFDVCKTKSELDCWEILIMKKIKFERSEHPLFSFIAIGKNRKIVRNIGISAFGKDFLFMRDYIKKEHPF